MPAVFSDNSYALPGPEPDSCDSDRCTSEGGDWRSEGSATGAEGSASTDIISRSFVLPRARRLSGLGNEGPSVPSPDSEIPAACRTPQPSGDHSSRSSSQSSPPAGSYRSYYKGTRRSGATRSRLTALRNSPLRTLSFGPGSPRHKENESNADVPGEGISDCLSWQEHYWRLYSAW